VSGTTTSEPGAARVPVDLSFIDGPYLRDILDQPRALERTLFGLKLSDDLRRLAARLQEGKFKVVVLTGMGSSFHALHPLNIELIQHGFTAIMVETSELLHYQSHLLDSETLIVTVSQSGQSVEVVRLLEMNAGKSSIIAVTNTADSMLAKGANAAVLTHAGEEFSVSCKSYVAALMALRWLGEVLCGRDVRRIQQQLECACPTVRDYVVRWREHAENLSQMLAGAQHLFLIGRGASLAAVGTGALIIKESSRFSAEGMSSAAFRHGPLEMLSDKTFVLIFSGDAKTRELNHRLFAEIRETGGRATIVGEDAASPSCSVPSTPPSIRPIVEILPAQMVSLALAALTGREPGRFVLASKVTKRE
jgi:glutamine---fructose-6-phosphate transaminase (isomerizing)